MKEPQKVQRRDASTPRQMLRWPQVFALLHRSRTSVWRDEKAGLFPKRVRQGKNSVAWFADEIAEFQNRLCRGIESEVDQ